MASGTEDVPVVLTELSVENVALIEAATLELAPGLNAVTGETGAGKTLLATALQLLLGGRARSETVRAGSKKATVEGSFSLPPEILQTVLNDSLGDLAEDLDTEDGLFLRRTLTGDGRSKCHVNGVTVTVRALATLGEKLVSYHGQRDQARLTEPAEQLIILDDFLDKSGQRTKTEHRELWGQVEADRRELQEITASSESRLRELDFLRFQVEEIESFGYSPDEAADLTRDRDRLRNITELMLEASTATAALSSEGDASTDDSYSNVGGALEATAAAVSALEGAVRHDESLTELLERLRGVSAEVEDLIYELRAYVEGLEADPSRLESVEDRLAELRTLERKYGEDIDGFFRDSKARLSRLENLDGETSEIESRIARGEEHLGKLSGALSRARASAAEELSQKVRENLSGLNLGSTVFKAELLPVESGPTGAERVEFVIQTNPGEPELPVRRYASGGELSRIMLAIRLAQERIEPGATYIFDEVDAGIGGETATAVGAKLRELGGRNQVLTITHLPQIASEAGTQIVVAKEESDGRTLTRIRSVEGDERRRELARMLSGRVDEASLAHASDLLVGR